MHFLMCSLNFTPSLPNSWHKTLRFASPIFKSSRMAESSKVSQKWLFLSLFHFLRTDIDWYFIFNCLFNAFSSEASVLFGHEHYVCTNTKLVMPILGSLAKCLRGLTLLHQDHTVEIAPQPQMISPPRPYSSSGRWTRTPFRFPVRATWRCARRRLPARQAR